MKKQPKCSPEVVESTVQMVSEAASEQLAVASLKRVDRSSFIRCRPAEKWYALAPLSTIHAMD